MIYKPGRNPTPCWCGFDSHKECFFQLPSNKLTWLTGKWNLNEDLEDGDFTASHVG